MNDHNYFTNLIWQIADLLRGPYRPPQYERVMLPMTVLRRFDCVLAPTKPKVLAEHQRRGKKLKGEALDAKLNKAAGQRFHNHSPLDFEKLKGDPEHIAQHLVSYIQGFSANVRHVFEYFEFETQVEKMQEANILYLVVSKFCDVDLHPDHVPNEQMGLIFENLIRRFNELANETAGDHFTPREVIRLMVSILFIHDDKLLATPGTVRKLLDPACGTGGMLAEAQNYLRDHHPAARLYVFGQDYNKRAFAIAAAEVRFLPRMNAIVEGVHIALCAKNDAPGKYVAFRSAKMRSFAERTATCRENLVRQSSVALPYGAIPRSQPTPSRGSAQSAGCTLVDVDAAGRFFVKEAPR